MTEQQVLDACKAGITAWQNAFNSQNAEGCAEQYMQDGVMVARPFGTFEGREAILSFWQDLISKGFDEVNYTDVQWEAEGDNGCVLTANWTMNKAYGVIHREHWVIDTDGKARLVYDEFEVQGER